MSLHGPAFAVALPSAPQIPSVPQEQPKVLFRYGEQSLWSTQFFVAAEEIAGGNFRMFSTPLNQVGQGAARFLSISETNIKEEGKTPNGVAYDVYGVASQIWMGDGADDAATDFDTPVNALGGAGSILSAANLINNVVLAWSFTQTLVEIAPMHMIGAGGGLFGSIANADAAVTTPIGSMHNGPGTIWMYRRHPVALPGNTSFGISLLVGNRAEAIDTSVVAIRVILFGYFKNLIEVS